MHFTGKIFLKAKANQVWKVRVREDSQSGDKKNRNKMQQLTQDTKIHKGTNSFKVEPIRI